MTPSLHLFFFSSPRKMARASLFPALLLVLSNSCHAAVQCSPSLGGGVCPSDNTCCPVYNSNGQLVSNTSSCIPPNPHIAAGPGVCCGRSTHTGPWGRPVQTGCPAEYRCASTVDADGKFKEYCSRVGDEENVDMKQSRRLVRRSSHTRGTICSNETDAIRPPVFPRYNLCSLNREAFTTVHGFPVKDRADYELAYYSNAGSITTDVRPSVRFVFIAIHGSKRNADGYLCAAQGAVQLQEQYPPESVLIVSPHFLVPEDGEPGFEPSQTGALPLRWNETHPIAHTWRYGADSIVGEVSSYDSMDNLLDHFVLDPKSLYPNLEAITIAGHSAGGQFVQRYALLSSHPALDAKPSERRRTKKRDIQIRLVGANPRSYCYLDDRRYADDGYERPPGDKMEVCPRWNEYQWGLDDGGDVVASYRDRAIELVGGTDALRKRFLQRNVTYLAGTKDILPLEGMCEDDLFQGGCRLERAHHYFDSLALFNNSSKSIIHQLHEVPGSNHDHTFMFQSTISLKAIFR